MEITKITNFHSIEVIVIKNKMDARALDHTVYSKPTHTNVTWNPIIHTIAKPIVKMLIISFKALTNKDHKKRELETLNQHWKKMDVPLTDVQKNL